ncbi:PREDICTED: vacuolar fusion protein MON1 homolog B-like [Chinchilla lanigera]|uniref:vacuolar fusion protein MON1 homolog B-like n=1 Tax=Chinchilla lanigera TaxID=34839 RepID=UPI00038EC05F|nr:PREDICTED: vacuolar fusion protein MON1 homolog B-like [Chinchilla lanigera]XP_005403490.1 PREDICTED: vacuolar fusion protein MON1 homolog B-like [Chinchilla lanigera]XP_013359445.1 PREDICTED: vacuolar fusion protein MON1 homolog B-like [Chinchilla lanigera]
MEAGGDAAAPAPGGAQDLEDTQDLEGTQFPGEEAGDRGVRSGPPDPGDADPEETGSEAKDEPPSRLSPLPQAEVPSSTREHWSSAASDSSPIHGPESGSGGQAGDPSDEDWRNQRKHVFVLSKAGKPTAVD